VAVDEDVPVEKAAEILGPLGGRRRPPLQQKQEEGQGGLDAGIIPEPEQGPGGGAPMTCLEMCSSTCRPQGQ